MVPNEGKRRREGIPLSEEVLVVSLDSHNWPGIVDKLAVRKAKAKALDCVNVMDSIDPVKCLECL
jgi:hypothetical protein